MVVWLRPQSILAIVTSLYYCLYSVSSKTYEKFWCATEEGYHTLSCPDETALLTDVTIRKIYRRTEMCAPDVHSEYLVLCQGLIDGSPCEGNKTCSIEVSSRNYIQCGANRYPPTYFFVKYTCTQIHTMCMDTLPIRNTLYGFIVSPAYPHPMADNLKCSITIEADPSMYIELAPIQIRLQDANKCRSEYLEIFGYLNSLSNNSSYDEQTANKNSKTIWKEYYTWCGNERSQNNPIPNTRFLIQSNSLYISLQTAISKKPRYFKIRYKIVPSIARSQYDVDGIARDFVNEGIISSVVPITTSTTILSTTIVVPTLQNNTMNISNSTITKKTYKKEILIGVIAGIILLAVLILIAVGIFIFIRRRRSAPTTTTKSPPSISTTNVPKKNVASPSTTNNNTTAKSGIKSPDKAPLLEPTTAPPAAVKRKLVPERTVQISDVNTSRFKSSVGATTGTATTGTTGKEGSSTSSEAVATSSAPSALKPVLTAADSGIYGADLSDDVPPVTKSISTAEPPKIYGIDLPDKSTTTTTSATVPTSSPAPSAPVTVLVNPLSESPLPSPPPHSSATATTTTTENAVLSALVVPNNVPMHSLSNEKDVRLAPLATDIDDERDQHFDPTVKSAYSNLIDATISENEGTIAGGSLASSAAQSRRTSNVKQPLLSSYETNNIETIPRKTPPFNPLHVILKKDANKYYTTEYI